MENLITFIDVKTLLAHYYCDNSKWHLACKPERVEDEKRGSGQETLDHATEARNAAEGQRNGHQASLGELETTATTNKSLDSTRRFNRRVLPACAGRYTRKVRWASWIHDLPMVVDQEQITKASPEAAHSEASRYNSLIGRRRLGWRAGRGSETLRSGGCYFVGLRTGLSPAEGPDASVVLSSIKIETEKYGVSGSCDRVSDSFSDFPLVLRGLSQTDAQWVHHGPRS